MSLLTMISSGYFAIDHGGPRPVCHFGSFAVWLSSITGEAASMVERMLAWESGGWGRKLNTNPKSTIM